VIYDYRRPIFPETDSVLPGHRPAVNVGLFCRARSSAQTKAVKKVARQDQGELAQYREWRRSAVRSDLDASTQRLLARGSRLTGKVLKQRISAAEDGRSGRRDLPASTAISTAFRRQGARRKRACFAVARKNVDISTPSATPATCPATPAAS